MAFGRVYFALGTLADGTALAAGGCSGGCSGNNALGQNFVQVGSSSETFDGSTWHTASNLTTRRNGVTNPRLLTDGRVLLCGGNDAFSTTYSSCEFFTPSGNVGTWTSSSLALPDAGSRPMTLASGKVLILDRAGTSSYLWDPAGTLAFGSAAALPTPQPGGRMTVLPDESVMLVGGYINNGSTFPSIKTVQIWSPSSNSWSAAASLSTARAYPVVATLADGRVLVVGGNGTAASNAQPLASVEVWSPLTQSWASAASMGTARNSPSGMRIK